MYNRPMDLARCGIMAVTRPNVIWLDSDFVFRTFRST